MDSVKPRIVLICHADDPLNRDALARWLASFADLAGIVALDETKTRLWRRVKREARRVGWFRFLDVLLFRFFYKMFLGKLDRVWEERRLAELDRRFPPLTADAKILRASSPNAPEVEAFLKEARPDLMIARCKTLLKPAIFTIPPRGTFVMHPGVCPQYRNAHGCFWALANNDLDNVGMTLLKIDQGVDTGPVYGWFRCAIDDADDSHIVIQHRVVFDNLDAIREKLLEIVAGRAEPISTAGKPSGEWGQPWMTAYWRWRKFAGLRQAARAKAKP